MGLMLIAEPILHSIRRYIEICFQIVYSGKVIILESGGILVMLRNEKVENARAVCVFGGGVA